MKYIVGIEGIRAAGEDITKYSHDDLKSNIIRLYKVKRDMKWKGPARQTFSQKFDLTIDNLYKMENALEVFGSFLVYCSDHYSDCVSELNKGWQEHYNELLDQINEEKIKDFM